MRTYTCTVCGGKKKIMGYEQTTDKYSAGMIVQVSRPCNFCDPNGTFHEVPKDECKMCADQSWAERCPFHANTNR